jgi:NADH-quinone oxidoreductase subunit C
MTPADEGPSKPPSGDAPKPPPARKGEVDEAALRAPAASAALDRLRDALPDVVEEVSYHCATPIVRLRAERLVEACTFLKSDPRCAMTHLADLCGVDMVGLGRPQPRFDVVYHLFSLAHRERLTLRAAVAEGAEIASVCGVWRGANWHEREAFDMFGIRFAGHPDLRRILMPETFDAFPLRKDFPLEGRTGDHGNWRRPGDESQTGR